MSYSLLMPLLFTSIVSGALGDYFPSYEECAPFTCGNSTIQYPFGPCGLIYVSCEEDHQIVLVFDAFYEGIVVGEIAKSSYSTGTLEMTPFHINLPELYSIPEFDFSTWYDWLSKGGFFNLSHSDMLGTFVNCTQQPPDISFNGSLGVRLDCTASNRYCFFYPWEVSQLPNCENYPIIVPTNKSYNISADKDFEQLYQRGFQIQWSTHDHTCDSCKATGGRCYSHFSSSFDSFSTNYYTYCICPDGDVHCSDCNDGENLLCFAAALRYVVLHLSISRSCFRTIVCLKDV